MKLYTRIYYKLIEWMEDVLLKVVERKMKRPKGSMIIVYVDKAKVKRANCEVSKNE